jgi:hypothetical protein
MIFGQECIAALQGVELGVLKDRNLPNKINLLQTDITPSEIC